MPIDEDTVYSENNWEELLDDDEISPFEAAFMEGWEEAL